MITLSLPRHRVLELGRPLIMGILNVTPDSFSDGGRYSSVDAAVAHARQMLDEGADVIDVGGESTRPGAQRVGAGEQIERIVPVIERIVAQLGAGSGEPSRAVVSVDTTRAAVAAAAIEAGAAIINDVSAGRDDAGMFALAASSGAPIILMHMLGQPATMQQDPRYADVVAEVEAFLRERAAAARQAGVGHDRILIDPGIGFGKTLEHNLALLAALPRFVAIGHPVVLGASRKRFLRSLATRPSQPAPEPDDVVGGTCATTALGVAAGVALFRVHDVAPNRLAADVAWAIAQPRR